MVLIKQKYVNKHCIQDLKLYYVQKLKFFSIKIKFIFFKFSTLKWELNGTINN